MTTEVKNLQVSRVLSTKRKEAADAIEKLMKKCERLGVKRPLVLYSEDYAFNFNDDNGNQYSIDVFDIKLVLPEAMKLGDWEAIAFIDYYEAVHIQFNIDVDYEYDFEEATKVQSCEHCNSVRSRRKAFVLKNVADGSFKKVGSTCVKDFTGIDPTKFFKAIQYMISAIEDFSSDEWGGGGSGWSEYIKDYRVWDINHIWTVAKGVLDVEGSYVKTEWETVDDGWYQRQIRTNFGEATADKVKEILFDENAVESVDAELVTGMRNWLRLMPVNTDFDKTIKEFAERKRVRTREIGLTGYVVEAYRKYVANLNAPVSEHVGTVGSKVQVILTVKTIGGYDNGYGWTNIYNMVDADGNKFTKFGTINARYSDSDEVNEGSVLTMKAEVKEHSVYRGTKQTILGRVSKY